MRERWPKEGVNLVINARGNGGLQVAAAELCNLGVEVRTMTGDISEPAVREQVLAACAQLDILVNNAGGPPPGDFRDWQRELTEGTGRQHAHTH